MNHRVICVVGTRPEAIKMALVKSFLHDTARMIYAVHGQHWDLSTDGDLMTTTVVIVP